MLKPCRLIRNNSIGRCMGLVEGIGGKVYHLVINMICRGFRYAVSYTALYSLIFVSVYKILPFLLHYGVLFL